MITFFKLGEGHETDLFSWSIVLFSKPFELFWVVCLKILAKEQAPIL